MEEKGLILPEPKSECAPTNDPCESLSLFGASESGEPLVAQILMMDFTPTEADTNYLKKKCSLFWDYIYSRKDLRSLMVKPDICNVVKEFSALADVDSVSGVTSVVEPEQELDRKQSTAVSMLEFVEQKGLINRVFEAKLQRSDCSLGSREYMEEDPINKPFPKGSLISGTCSITHTSCPYVLKTRRSNKEMRSNYPRRDSTQAQKLCRTLQEWDESHPKSMKQPGPPPSLCYQPVVQRKIKM